MTILSPYCCRSMLVDLYKLGSHIAKIPRMHSNVGRTTFHIAHQSAVNNLTISQSHMFCLVHGRCIPCAFLAALRTLQSAYRLILVYRFTFCSYIQAMRTIHPYCSIAYCIHYHNQVRHKTKSVVQPTQLTGSPMRWVYSHSSDKSRHCHRLAVMYP
jgi:hypothetical protein